MGWTDRPLWPNLEGSEEAPATAKRGAEKNVFMAASIVLGEDGLASCRMV